MAPDREHDPVPHEPAHVGPQVIPVPVRQDSPSGLRAALVIGAALVLVAAAVATSFAADPSSPPAASSAPGDAGDTSAGVPGLLAPFLLADPDIDGTPLDEDLAGIGRGRDITITAIDSSAVTLTTEDGWTRTITVTDAVALTKGGQEIGLADLAVGDQVRLRQQRNDDGTWTVTALRVVVPGIRGTVSDVSATGFKVTTRGGAVWTVTLNGSTEFRFGTADGSLSDVTNGAAVVVLGESSGENALTALTVRVVPDRVVGTVTSKTADTIVVETRRGEKITVHVDADTTFRVAGVENAGLDDVAVDMQIGASGRARADGSLDADAVAAGTGRRGVLDRLPFPGWRDGGRDGDGDGTPSGEATPAPTTS
jgi:hypothetical protein